MDPTTRYAAETARAVALDPLQVHGGIGFTVEHDLHFFLRRAHSLQGFYGDERELAGTIGRQRVTSGIDGAHDLSIDALEAI